MHLPPDAGVANLHRLIGFGRIASYSLLNTIYALESQLVTKNADCDADPQAARGLKTPVAMPTYRYLTDGVPRPL
jgi:hypothetical protein